MIGQTISHYKILEKLGEGGMGVMYKAEDTKLHRTVALKFLPPELTRDEEAKKRFVHEAQAASSLDHNNICAVHEIDETVEGQLFICMNYYDGETLKKKIEKGPLKLDDAIEITIQIAQGLLKAHEQKIIHRDIKPANIFITKDGDIKILDFGLAKLTGQKMMTKLGSTLGTIAYMSPEQAHGEEVNQRTDIWSLGVVLYEMIIGKLPFRGDYEQAILYSIMSEEPSPITSLRTGIPMELERIVMKALAKKQEERYQHIDEMLVDLRKLKTTIERSEIAAVPFESKKKLRKLIFFISGMVLIVTLLIAIWMLLQINSDRSEKSKFIAVLPFHPITNSEEDKSFAEGIHDDILTQLGKIRDLKVIARTTMMHYQNTQQTIKEIADELGVGVILEGSTRRSGNVIRITAQLIDAETEEHLWADSYDRQYADIFAIQSDVAQKIATALQIKLAKEELHAIQTKPTENLEAWEYFRKGKYFWNFAYGYEGNLKSAEMFEKACELDTDFTLAFAWQAYIHAGIYVQAPDMNLDMHIKKYENAIDRAITLSPDLPEINLARGYYFRSFKKDLRSAIKEAEIANIKRPNDPDILRLLSMLTGYNGDNKGALRLAEKIYELDPKGNPGASTASWQAFLLGRYSESERWADIMIANNPASSNAYVRKLWVIIFGYGDLKRAEDILEKARKNVTMEKTILTDFEYLIYFYKRDYTRALLINYSLEDWHRFIDRAILLKLMNRNKEAKANFDSLRVSRLELLKKQSDYPGYDPIFLAIAYAGLGEKARALNELAKVDSISTILKYYLVKYNWIQVYFYILLGDNSSALQYLEKNASSPWSLTPALLRLDPMLDPLRSDPRFKKIIAKAEERIKENKQ
jgi:non-specific serine/threonine protein kinase